MSSSPRVIAIDTDAYAYAHHDASANAEKQELGKRVRHYIESGVENGTVFLLPSIVLSEILCCYPDSEHDKVISALAENFTIGHFGYEAVKVLAQLRRDRDAAQKARSETVSTKRQISNDQIVAAIAIAEGASELLTGNQSDYATLTAGKLAIKNFRNLPKPHIQPPIEGLPASPEEVDASN